jgi:lysophospholipase L1-like esterase
MATRWRLAALAGIVILQFVVFETALRVAGGSEAAPAFQRLFLDDPVIGYRLRPSTAVRFTTADFSTDIAINSAGVRDGELGPKAPDERRIVVLGDSLVLAVQVPLRQTFCKLMEARLNARSNGLRYRVINAGVQGYGPVEEVLFYERVVAPLDPDLVVLVTFVANDAVEAYEQAFRLHAGGPSIATPQRSLVADRVRHVVRRSMVLQIVRQRMDIVRGRFAWGNASRPDLRLLTYATPEPPELTAGFEVSRTAVARLAADAARHQAKMAIVLMPARLQLDDDEFERMRGPLLAAGYEMDVDSATTRFKAALQPLGLPILDMLPAFRQAPDPHRVFFDSTVHLTPTGHAIAADAMLAFLDARGLTP